MEYTFNTIAPLRYRKSTILIITILYVLITLSSPYFSYQLMPEGTNMWFSLIPLILLLSCIPLIENKWLYKTTRTGHLTWSYDALQAAEQRILWKDVRGIRIKRYISCHHQSTIPRWKDSYMLTLETNDQKEYVFYLQKKAAYPTPTDVAEVIVRTPGIDMRIRKWYQHYYL